MQGKNSERGEIDQILEDIKSESKEMMKELMEVDNILISVKDSIDFGDFDKEELINKINDIRMRIGALEKDDVKEEKYEEIADNLILKLKKWVDLIV